MVKIHNKVVYGGPALSIPGHLNFGQFVLDELRKICETKADCVALINGETGEKTTYKILLQGLVNIGSGLRKLGVKRGDVVALCSENRVEYLAAALGALTCGACITPLNAQYTKDEMTHVLNISKPNLVLCSAAAIQANYATFKTLPFIKTIIQINGVPIERNVLSYKDIAVQTDVQDYEAEDVQGSTDICYLLYSSGTTGLPKGVMLSHVNVLYSLAYFNEREDLIEDITLLTVVPWYHAYGLMSTVNYILVKKKLVYLPGFNPRVYLNAIQEHKVNVLVAVPPIVVFLGKSPLAKQYDLSSVFAVWCGAAPLTSDTINDALKSLPNCMGVFQGYGMTETSLAATTDADIEKSKPGSAGYPLKGVKVKVVDLETRKRLGCNETGEVCLKGPINMKGYAGNDAATREMFDDEGYLKSGDIGYYDNDGCFFVVDRLKELIKYKGSQVPPAEVESVVLEHPGVAECAVVGAPDDAAGELPTAFVVSKQNVHLTQKDIIDFAAQRLSSAKRLHGGVIFIDAIPKNPSGKILRRVLRQQLKQYRKSKL
ncbi:unnamed protein product [Diatraea saccharalis]|uniref:4-coumarate--CoA ligase n=1 Tax=Diatraea saccharalis TaxID=40085 RepID=A0A9N9R4E1_9NEOP|nr:unnamed protein product [Diatraea saccharalis]